MSQIVTTRDLLKSSMIRQNKEGSVVVRCISAVDIFSFIPVPKSRPVSTKCSLIGTVIFFLIFFGYIIYDLVTFITDNPPMPNSYYEPLTETNYTSPKFSMVFMGGENLDEGINPEGIFNYTLQQNIKRQKFENKTPSAFVSCNQNVTKQWMGNSTFENYKQNLLCPKEDVELYIGGLLYVYEYAYNPSIKILQCYNGKNWCRDRKQIQKIQSGGRIFLFIEKDEGSEYNLPSVAEGKYLLFNFFLVQEMYKRINIQFQVNREIILPDYLTRWTERQNTWLEMYSSNQMDSDVIPLTTNDEASRERALMITLEFTLNPSVKVTKVAYLTLIDHIAQWGALWGVQFAFFAIFFLSYNSRKYYKKNPRWEKYDENENEQNLIYTDQKEKD